MTTDWNSPAVLEQDGLIFLKFMHVVMGLYIWEWAISLDFDWLYVSGQRRLTLTLIPYFLNRYFFLFFFIGLAISLNATSEINCQALYTFLQIMGVMCLGLATMNLSIRCITIWGQNRKVAGGLGVLIITHWVVLMNAIKIVAVWVPGSGCVIIKTPTTMYTAGYVFAMSIDFIVLVLTLYRLGFNSGNGPQSRLANRLVHDGVVYFVIAFVANVAATVMMVLDLNPILAVITAVPASMTASIAATRAIRRLVNFSHQGNLANTAHTSGDYNAASMRFIGNPELKQQQSVSVNFEMNKVGSVDKELR
jgi:hypothetical protein